MPKLRANRQRHTGKGRVWASVPTTAPQQPATPQPSPQQPNGPARAAWGVQACYTGRMIFLPTNPPQYTKGGKLKMRPVRLRTSVATLASPLGGNISIRCFVKRRVPNYTIAWQHLKLPSKAQGVVALTLALAPNLGSTPASALANQLLTLACSAG